MRTAPTVPVVDPNRVAKTAAAGSECMSRSVGQNPLVARWGVENLVDDR